MGTAEAAEAVAPPPKQRSVVGCWGQLTVMGANRCIYSSYHLGGSCGNVVSQFAIMRAVCFLDKPWSAPDVAETEGGSLCHCWLWLTWMTTTSRALPSLLLSPDCRLSPRSCLYLESAAGDRARYRHKLLSLLKLRRCLEVSCRLTRAAGSSPWSFRVCQHRASDVGQVQA